MPFELIWEKKGIRARFSGSVTEKDVMFLNDLMYGDIRFEKISYQISDYSEATSINITPMDAKVIGTMDKVSSHWTSRNMRNAVVTTDEKFIPVVKTYFKQFEGTAWECRIFENLDMAYAWVEYEK